MRYIADFSTPAIYYNLFAKIRYRRYVLLTLIIILHSIKEAEPGFISYDAKIYALPEHGWIKDRRVLLPRGSLTSTGTHKSSPPTPQVEYSRSAIEVINRAW